MTKRDYKSQPVTDALGLDSIIGGLVGDLQQLRMGQITIQDAQARAGLAKQIFNGCRIYLNGQKILAEQATDVPRTRAIADNPNDQKE